MMQNIKAKGDSDQHKELLHDSTECEIKDSEQTISSESTMSNISASPIDHHCLWYKVINCYHVRPIIKMFLGIQLCGGRCVNYN